MAAPGDRLLVTDEVAELLHVHPKQVYRLLARGLPGRRVGREWRFDRAEVLEWAGGRPAAPETSTEGRPPPLLAANGDVVVERLIALVGLAGGPLLGFVQADRDSALEQLLAGGVLLAGCHGREPPELVGDERLARIHLVLREVGLVGREVAPAPADLVGQRLAGRPASAGIRVHLEAALREARVSASVLRTAVSYASHRDVVHAVVRGDADAGLTTRAWASRVGLPFRALATEAYGLMLLAKHLGDPRVVRVCEVAQGAAFRAALAEIPGYDPQGSGAVEYHFAR